MRANRVDVAFELGEQVWNYTTKFRISQLLGLARQWRRRLLQMHEVEQGIGRIIGREWSSTQRNRSFGPC